MTALAIDPERDVFLVIDVQNDFCPGGALAVPHGDEVVASINRLMRSFPHVVLTQDWHPPGHRSLASAYPGRASYDVATLPYGDQTLWPDHCVQGSPGADFHPRLEATQAELILRKGFHREVDSYSAFRENDRRTTTGLAGYLRERGFRRVVLAGLAYDFCVLWSAQDARRFGFEAVVIADACRALDLAGSRAGAARGRAEAGVRMASSAELALA
jgi:nicotinamidase/pyrazinamidase